MEPFPAIQQPPTRRTQESKRRDKRYSELENFPLPSTPQPRPRRKREEETTGTRRGPKPKADAKRITVTFRVDSDTKARIEMLRFALYKAGVRSENGGQPTATAVLVQAIADLAEKHKI